MKVNAYRILLCLVVTALLTSSPFTRSFGQSPNTVIYLPLYVGSLEGDALEIVDIKVQGKSVAPNQPFLADNSWLKSLTVRVRNNSSKSISHIRMSISILREKNAPLGIGFSLVYGVRENNQAGREAAKPLRPNEEVDLHFNESQYAETERLVARVIDPANIRKVSISTTGVEFSDGSSRIIQLRKVSDRQ